MEKKYRSDAAHIFNPIPENEKETLQSCNALFKTGMYPIITDGCFHVGMAGGCGPDCYVYRDGECGEPEGILNDCETEEEIERHKRLYGNK